MRLLPHGVCAVWICAATLIGVIRTAVGIQQRTVDSSGSESKIDSSVLREFAGLSYATFKNDAGGHDAIVVRGHNGNSAPKMRIEHRPDPRVRKHDHKKPTEHELGQDRGAGRHKLADQSLKAEHMKSLKKHVKHSSKTQHTSKKSKKGRKKGNKPMTLQEEQDQELDDEDETESDEPISRALLSPRKVHAKDDECKSFCSKADDWDKVCKKSSCAGCTDCLPPTPAPPPTPRPPEAEAPNVSTDYAALRPDSGFIAILNNDLGDQGPGPNNLQEPTIRLLLTPNPYWDGELLIENVSTYSPVNTEMNGLDGAMAVINVAEGKTVILNFTFIDPATNEPQNITAFTMVFFDFDFGPGGKASEEVILHDADTVKNFFVSGNSSVNITPQIDESGDTDVYFDATEQGSVEDNPQFPYILSGLQLRKCICIEFADLSYFTLQFNVENGGKGRNFMTASQIGPPSLNTTTTTTPGTTPGVLNMAPMEEADYNIRMPDGTVVNSSNFTGFTRTMDDGPRERWWPIQVATGTFCTGWLLYSLVHMSNVLRHHDVTRTEKGFFGGFQVVETIPMFVLLMTLISALSNMQTWQPYMTPQKMMPLQWIWMHYGLFDARNPGLNQLMKLVTVCNCCRVFFRAYGEYAETRYIHLDDQQIEEMGLKGDHNLRGAKKVKHDGVHKIRRLAAPLWEERTDFWAQLYKIACILFYTGIFCLIYGCLTIQKPTKWGGLFYALILCQLYFTVHCIGWILSETQWVTDAHFAHALASITELSITFAPPCAILFVALDWCRDPIAVVQLRMTVATVCCFLHAGLAYLSPFFMYAEAKDRTDNDEVESQLLVKNKEVFLLVSAIHWVVMAVLYFVVFQMLNELFALACYPPDMLYWAIFFYLIVRALIWIIPMLGQSFLRKKDPDLWTHHGELNKFVGQLKMGVKAFPMLAAYSIAWWFFAPEHDPGYAWLWGLSPW